MYKPANARLNNAEVTAELNASVDHAQLYAEYRRLAAEQAALRRLATLVARGVEPPKVFDAVASEMRRCVRAEIACLWRYETADEITLIGASYHSGSLLKWPVGTLLVDRGNDQQEDRSIPGLEMGAPDAGQDSGEQRCHEFGDRGGNEMTVQNQPSLYDRLGGVYNIATVIDDLIDRVMADDRLNANPRVDEAHHRVSPAGFKYYVTEMACGAAGGPQQYSGRSMGDSHRHLEITEEEWAPFINDLQQTLNKFNVPQPEQEELKAIIESTHDVIVVSPLQPATP